MNIKPRAESQSSRAFTLGPVLSLLDSLLNPVCALATLHPKPQSTPDYIGGR